MARLIFDIANSILNLLLNPNFAVICPIMYSIYVYLFFGLFI